MIGAGVQPYVRDALLRDLFNGGRRRRPERIPSPCRLGQVVEDRRERAVSLDLGFVRVDRNDGEPLVGERAERLVAELLTVRPAPMMATVFMTKGPILAKLSPWSIQRPASGPIVRRWQRWPRCSSVEPVTRRRSLSNRSARIVSAASPAATSVRFPTCAGVCKVRFDRGGRLLVPWGYVGGVQCDPIEKKPFLCASRRARLQLRDAWLRSALLGTARTGSRPGTSRPGAVSAPLDVAPEDLVRDAIRLNARVVVSTYNEPLITSEWAVEIFSAAGRWSAHGIRVQRQRDATCARVIRPWIDLSRSI